MNIYTHFPSDLVLIEWPTGTCELLYRDNYGKLLGMKIPAAFINNSFVKESVRPYQLRSKKLEIIEKNTKAISEKPNLVRFEH